jgi:hypothetical protein
VAVSPLFALAVAALIVVAGAVNGLAGFGFAIVGTLALATAVDPALAVVFMILPVVAVNLSLVSELSTAQLRTCGRRFGPLIAAALIGTLVGLLVLSRLPAAPLQVGLGLVAFGFVAVTQDAVDLPGVDRAREGCFVERPAAMGGVGAVSGLLFGGTNVGVQLIAYLRSCDLPHGLFVGVVAMVFLGLNGVRVAAAGALGLYPSPAVLAASAAAAVPAVAGVAVGRRLRSRVGEATRRQVVLGLLTVIGARLTLGGLGIA